MSKRKKCPIVGYVKPTGRKYHVIVNGQVVNTISAKNKVAAKTKAEGWIMKTVGHAVKFTLQHSVNARSADRPKRSHAPQYIETEVLKVSR